MSTTAVTRCLLVACILLLSLGLTTAALSPLQGSEFRMIKIGTGNLGGVYFPLGSAICRLFNRNRSDDLLCLAEPSAGSQANIEGLRKGSFAVGVVQSDVQNEARLGLGPFADAGPYEDLRALFSVHPESLTVVARDDSGIENFRDLRGRRVNIGNVGSGQRVTVEILLGRLGWALSDFAAALDFPPSQQARALCSGEADAIIYMVGHPSGTIQEATFGCKTHLVEVTGSEIDALIEEFPYFSRATIPGGVYRGSPDSVETFGVRAIVMVNGDLPEEAAYEIVKAVFGNFGDFRRLHSAFVRLKRDEMVSKGLTVPLHPGAERYFREVGLLR